MTVQEEHAAQRPGASTPDPSAGLDQRALAAYLEVHDAVGAQVRRLLVEGVRLSDADRVELRRALGDLDRARHGHLGRVMPCLSGR